MHASRSLPIAIQGHGRKKKLEGHICFRKSKEKTIFVPSSIRQYCFEGVPRMETRDRPRFFDQVGHKTMYASSGNKHFFTKSCHRQTY